MSEKQRNEDYQADDGENPGENDGAREINSPDNLNTPPTHDQSCENDVSLNEMKNERTKQTEDLSESNEDQNMSNESPNNKDALSNDDTEPVSEDRPSEASVEAAVSEDNTIEDSFTTTDQLSLDLPDATPSDTSSIGNSDLIKAVPPPGVAEPESSDSSKAHGATSQDGSSSKNGATSSSPSESVYHIKWVNFMKKLVPIITQNENGPCPLLAIMNVLLLQGRVKLAQQMEIISARQLMDYLGECVLENVPSDDGVAMPARLNFEQNMGDAMAVMPKLQTGLDVNVRFTGVREFEYTTECIIFDLLQISLYHGWLVDPQNRQEVEAVGTCTYNQLVEKIISEKSSDKSELVSQALIAEQFLESSASQLTYHGLCELASQLKDDELAVLFRNNHFTTLYRYKNELFQLVTDQGFLTESNVVWETLSNVEGDCNFVDSEFRTYTKPEPCLQPVEPSNVLLNSDEQIDQDYLVALSLQQEQQEEPAQWSPAVGPEMSDLELARSLQEEERRAAMEEAGEGERRAQARRSPAQANPRRGNQRPEHREHREEKKSDCCIL